MIEESFQRHLKRIINNLFPDAHRACIYVDNQSIDVEGSSITFIIFLVCFICLLNLSL